MPQCEYKPEKMLEINGVYKNYNTTKALVDFSLSLEQGAFCCLLGPSGCGKSTILRIIAGLEEPDRGMLRINGRDVVHVPAQMRNVGMVFQNYALFPHMNVLENIAFGLKALKVSQGSANKRIAQMLEVVRLTSLAYRSISELSGGEQQRVALARALITNPEVLLLDEPFSNLDAKLKQSMREDLLGIINTFNITSVLVTHDQEEAMTLASNIALINKGELVQQGAAEMLYNNPANSFSAEFLGRINLFPVDVFLRMFGDNYRDKMSDSCKFVAIRPEAFRPEEKNDSSLKFVVKRITFCGSFYRYNAYILSDQDEQFQCVFEWPAHERRLLVNEEITMRLEQAAICFLDD